MLENSAHPKSKRAVLKRIYGYWAFRRFLLGHAAAPHEIEDVAA